MDEKEINELLDLAEQHGKRHQVANMLASGATRTEVFSLLLGSVADEKRLHPERFVEPKRQASWPIPSTPSNFAPTPPAVTPITDGVTTTPKNRSTPTARGIGLTADELAIHSRKQSEIVRTLSGGDVETARAMFAGRCPLFG